MTSWLHEGGVRFPHLHLPSLSSSGIYGAVTSLSCRKDTLLSVAFLVSITGKTTEWKFPFSPVSESESGLGGGRPDAGMPGRWKEVIKGTESSPCSVRLVHVTYSVGVFIKINEGWHKTLSIGIYWHMISKWRR